jgi:hypothetical protein
MAFKVRFSGRGESQDYGDDDGFEFLEGGVLAIHFDDETKWSEYHNPAKWDKVTADPEHLVGLNTPYIEDDDEDDDEDFDEEYGDEEYEDEDYEDEDIGDEES